MNVKRLLFFSLVLMTIIGLFGATPRASAATCYTYKFTTFDNGMPQQLWAVDNFTSQVCITQTGTNTYTVVFNDNGSSFVTLNAKSPGGDGTTFVSAGVRGLINGGETVVIQGTLKSGLPSVVGPVDFRNDHTPNKYFLPFFSSITSVSYVSWGWTYSTCGNGTWVDNATTEALYSSVGPNATMGDIQGQPAACQNQQPAGQWFNPNDGRVDPRPGDRLVVYCNTNANPPNLDVYGINDEGVGFHLYMFKYANVLAAGPGGLTKNLGVKGVLSLMVDDQNNFWIAWNGRVGVAPNTFYANGQPGSGFAKGFTCPFSRQ